MMHILIVGLSSLLLTGCAGMLRDSTQMLEITSDPPGAKTELSTGQECVTPCLLEVERKNDIQVKMSLEGYEAAISAVESRMDAVGVTAEVGNVYGGLWVWGAAGAYALVESWGGGGAGAGPFLLAGGVVAYILIASGRDRREGKTRSLRPNPLHVELEPRRQDSVSSN